MKKYQVCIEGTCPLLQHKFGMVAQVEAAQQVKMVSGQRDFSGEWKNTCYLLGNEIVQPAEHIWQAMVRAGVNFVIKGRGRKTYKDMISRAVIVEPDLISFGIILPEEITTDPSLPVYVDIRPVRIQRARVMRERLALRKGWQLSFELLCLDDQLPTEVLQAILTYAGESIGIGDYRPRFGRFRVVQFQESGT